MSLFNIETDFHNSLGNDFHYGLQDLQPQNPFNNQDASDYSEQLFQVTYFKDLNMQEIVSDARDQSYQDSYNFQNQQHIQELHDNNTQNNIVPYEEFINIMLLIDNEESVVSEIINGANDKNSHEISHK
ncbi:22343_t:CDS:2 [Gigaspora margarita]|uniref:22343_t:CDS:1 n=1 Tax=Gigaspora margarita TaxID=4874 RepID=A0ABN7VFU3_GIGMA|nr:22343_t:CDS:2 [Gigaspora margarita]